MKNKRLAIIFILLIAVLTPIMMLTIPFFRYKDITKEHIVEDLKIEKRNFEAIVNYLEEEDGDISIRKIGKDKIVIERFNEKVTGYIENLEISDMFLKDAIWTIINKKNYRSIVEERQTIYFIKKVDIGYEEGVFYTKDGTFPEYPKIAFTDLIEGNWYYYIAD